MQNNRPVWSDDQWFSKNVAGENPLIEIKAKE